MLSAAHDGIKAARAGRAGWCSAESSGQTSPSWLERVFATPGTDAIHKFDIANVHLRGPVGARGEPISAVPRMARRSRGFKGPLWVTELGYPADPAYQVDPSFTGGDAGQAGYLTQSLVDLGEAGAEQVFVTLRDNGEGAYASEGLVHMDEAPGGATTRRESFYAVRRLATNWDPLMAWRREQPKSERGAQLYEAVAAFVVGRRAGLLWHSAYPLAAPPMPPTQHRGRDAISGGGPGCACRALRPCAA